MAKKLELLSPAGDMERLRMSVAYGADAVYLAGRQYGMRSFAGNFSRDELKEAADFCSAHGVAVHVTCNTMPRNDEIDALPEYLAYLQEIGVSAVIVGDVGVLSLAKRYAPKVKVHISTQASVTNYQAATAWHDLGASRVILARELTLDEISAIRAKTPQALELEAFVHGAMCVSYSGRCVLSNYMSGRDASRGACAQPCRYKYALMEEQRPGEFFPVEEDERGTYIFNSKDMRMIDHVPELLAAGLDSLKIEGRAKSAYYAAVVTGAYRHAVDAALAGEPLDPVWRSELDKVSHRPYSEGFYYGHPEQYTGAGRSAPSSPPAPPAAEPSSPCGINSSGERLWSWWGLGSSLFPLQRTTWLTATARLWRRPARPRCLCGSPSPARRPPSPFSAGRWPRDETPLRL